MLISVNPNYDPHIPYYYSNISSHIQDWQVEKNIHIQVQYWHLDYKFIRMLGLTDLAFAGIRQSKNLRQNWDRDYHFKCKKKTVSLHYDSPSTHSLWTAYFRPSIENHSTALHLTSDPQFKPMQPFPLNCQSYISSLSSVIINSLQSSAIISPFPKIR